MKNYVQDGNVLTLTAPAGGVVSGFMYLIGALFVIASGDAAAGDAFEGETVGVFSLPKNAADTAVAGDKAYLEAAGLEITTISTANTLIGVFAEDADNTKTVAAVRLGIVT